MSYKETDINGMNLLEMKDSSELNCLESTLEKSIEITAKGANIIGRYFTGQWEKNANAAKGKHSSLKCFASRWTLMRSLAVVTIVMISRHHFFRYISIANMPNLSVLVWLLSGRSELILPESRAGETHTNSQMEAKEQRLASCCSSLHLQNQANPMHTCHQNPAPTCCYSMASTHRASESWKQLDLPSSWRCLCLVTVWGMELMATVPRSNGNCWTATSTGSWWELSLHFPTRQKWNSGGLDHSCSIFRLHIPFSSGKQVVMDEHLGPQGERAWGLSLVLSRRIRMFSSSKMRPRVLILDPFYYCLQNTLKSSYGRRNYWYHYL